MILNFTKMSGTGNDFVVIDNRNKVIEDASAVAIKLCSPKTSIGADGMLLLEHSEVADVRMRYLNSDGSEVEMCGNGARCISYFAHTLGLPKEFTLETEAGVLHADILENAVRISMPEAVLNHESYNLKLDNEDFEIFDVNSGVPHKIVYVDDLENFPVDKIGSLIRYNGLFDPPGTNANFVKIIDEHTIIQRTYERGVEAETLSCGTGAVASALNSGRLGLIKSPCKVLVRLPAELTIEFDKDFKNIHLTGDVDITFTGQVNYT